MIDIKYDSKLFKDKLNKLLDYENKIPFYTSPNIHMTNLISEIHHSLITEGEFSSRREIKEAFKGLETKEVTDKHYKNYILGYGYVKGNRSISSSDIFTLYSILTKNIDMGKQALDEGSMFRKSDVTIGASSYNDKTHFGADPKEIANELKTLIEYINDDKEESLIIKVIVAHFYFELIHPFYDYNGRTGRLLSQWIMSIKNKQHNSLNYFSTAVGSYREKYLKAFSDCVDKQSPSNKYKRKYDLNKFISRILDLLILNQYQYNFISELEIELNNKGESFTSNEKLLVLGILKKYEVQGVSDSWSKANQLKDEVDLMMSQPQFSKLVDSLVEKKVIDKLSSKPVKIKLLKDYTLIKDTKA